MSKIDEMIESSSVYFEYEDDKHEVYRLMKEYAEWYAQKLISLIEDETWIDDFGEFIITQTEIQKINLPEHD